MNDLERRVVALIAAGYARWEIADQLDMSESTLRPVIRRLCARYDCPMHELPGKVKGEE